MRIDIEFQVHDEEDEPNVTIDNVDLREGRHIKLLEEHSDLLDYSKLLKEILTLLLKTGKVNLTKLSNLSSKRLTKMIGSGEVCLSVFLDLSPSENKRETSP